MQQGGDFRIDTAMGSDAAALAAAAIQAERLKSDGNDYFKRNRFGAAIDAYTEVFLSFLFPQSFLILRVESGDGRFRFTWGA